MKAMQKTPETVYCYVWALTVFGSFKILFVVLS